MRITIFLVFAAVVIGTIMLAEPASACVSNQFCLGYILVLNKEDMFVTILTQ